MCGRCTSAEAPTDSIHTNITWLANQKFHWYIDRSKRFLEHVRSFGYVEYSPLKVEINSARNMVCDSVVYRNRESWRETSQVTPHVHT